MVKRSHGVNVHNLIQKIENHPQRQALQSDLSANVEDDHNMSSNLNRGEQCMKSENGEFGQPFPGRWQWCHTNKKLQGQWCPVYHRAETSTSSL